MMVSVSMMVYLVMPNMIVNMLCAMHIIFLLITIRRNVIYVSDVTWNKYHPHPPAPSPIKGEGELD
jgi:hypothetical protein